MAIEASANDDNRGSRTALLSLVAAAFAWAARLIYLQIEGMKSQLRALAALAAHVSDQSRRLPASVGGADANLRPGD